MSEARENAERVLFLKIMDSNKKTVVDLKSFKTQATQSELETFTDSLVKRINALYDIEAQPPGVGDALRSKRFAFCIRDDETGEVSIPIYLFGSSVETVHMIRDEHLKKMEKDIKKTIYQIYERMLRYLEWKGWDFYGVTDAQWRQVCGACHPLFYSGDWSEERREKFEKTSWASVKVGIVRGTYKLRKNRPIQTEANLSKPTQDKKGLVKKRLKRVYKPVLTSKKKGGSNENQPEATRPSGRSKHSAGRSRR